MCESAREKIQGDNLLYRLPNDKENGLQELFDQDEFYPGDLIGIDVEITKINVGRGNYSYHNYVEIIPKSKPPSKRELRSVSGSLLGIRLRKDYEVKITKSGGPYGSEDPDSLMAEQKLASEKPSLKKSPRRFY